MHKIKIILVIAVVFSSATFFFFALLQPTMAGKPFKPNHSRFVETQPIWEVTKPGTAKSVKWVNHKPNPRFALFDNGTPNDPADDWVLDKQTRLVWARAPEIEDGYEDTWKDGINHCLHQTIQNQRGARLPSIEELLSLVDLSVCGEPGQICLPEGHPFLNIMPGSPANYMFWSSTTAPTNHDLAYFVILEGGIPSQHTKTEHISKWCVRGGQGNYSY